MRIFAVEKNCGCAKRIRVRERAMELDTERRECWRQTKARRRLIIMHQATTPMIQAVKSWGCSSSQAYQSVGDQQQSYEISAVGTPRHGAEGSVTQQLALVGIID